MPGPRSRSKNGCLTCRRRKKKCDESSYPSCKNCASIQLQCTWPDHVTDKRRKAHSRASPASPSIQGSNLSTALFVVERDKVGSLKLLLSRETVTRPNTKSTSFILQRISMQQDCVEDSHEDLLSYPEALNNNNDMRDIVPAASIKDRIAKQLDIFDESRKNLVDLQQAKQ